MSRLTELPTEILEKILLHLPSQDVVKLEVVRYVVATQHNSALTFRYTIQISRQFQDLTRNSPILQYKRNLLSAGLVENPHSLCDFSQRRKLCEEYERKWSNAGRVVLAVHELPDDLSPQRHTISTHGGDIITSHSIGDGCLRFLRLPPVTSQLPIKRWSIPPFPFNVKAFAVYPPDSILAVAEEKERWVLSSRGEHSATDHE